MYLHFYIFESAAACKVLRFCNYFFSVASGSILIVIAVDRYRKVCRPMNSQLSIGWSRFAIVIAISFSILSATPSAIFHNVVEVNITTSTGNTSILGYDCTNERDDDHHLLITLYNIYQFALFISTVSVLVTLYSLVGRQLYRIRSSQLYLRSTHVHHVSTKKLTIMMLIITIAFVVGYLPHLGLVLWRTISQKYEPNTFSDDEHMAF